MKLGKIITAFILGIALIASSSVKSEAATVNWNIYNSAPGYPSIVLTSTGTITYGLTGTATFDGFATISNSQKLGSTVALEATISGSGETGYYTPGGFDSDSVTFQSATAYNVGLSTQKVIVTTPFKGKANFSNLPESLRVYANAYYRDNEGYENSWTGYYNAL